MLRASQLHDDVLLLLISTSCSIQSSRWATGYTFCQRTSRFHYLSACVFQNIDNNLWLEVVKGREQYVLSKSGTNDKCKDLVGLVGLITRQLLFNPRLIEVAAELQLLSSRSCTHKQTTDARKEGRRRESRCNSSSWIQQLSGCRSSCSCSDYFGPGPRLFLAQHKHSGVQCRAMIDKKSLQRDASAVSARLAQSSAEPTSAERRPRQQTHQQQRESDATRCKVSPSRRDFAARSHSRTIIIAWMVVVAGKNHHTNFHCSWWCCVWPRWDRPNEGKNRFERLGVEQSTRNDKVKLCLGDHYNYFLAVLIENRTGWGRFLSKKLS